MRALRATARVQVLGLRATPPGYAAALISLPAQPAIGFEVRVAGGEVTKLPWLRGEIEKLVREAIAEECLWPNRIVLPASTPTSSRPVLSPRALDALRKDDPLLRWSEGRRTLGETWGEEAEEAPSLDIVVGDRHANEFPKFEV